MNAKALNQKILEFEGARIRVHVRSAIKRLEAKFEQTLAADDDHASAIALIEKINLACGDRRTTSINVSADRRHLRG